MSGGWLRSLLERPGEKPLGVESSYECSHCGAAFDEWPGACPGCGGLVVRIVEDRR